MIRITKNGQRRVAIANAVYQLQRAGFDLHDIDRTVSADDALKALDDYMRLNPDEIGAIWYAHATERQIELFRQEWAARQAYWKKTDEGIAALALGDFDRVLDTIQDMMNYLGVKVE